MRSLLLLPVCASPALAQVQLLVPQATNDRVMLVDGFDGTIIDPIFIDLRTSTGTAPATPVEAKVAPNGEVWISDQVADRIFRFSGDGTTYLGESTAALDNIRGFEVAYGSVWVSNAGTGNGAPGTALVQLDLNLNVVANHATVGDPFDALTFQWMGVDGLLVCDIAGDDLLFFDPANPAGTTVFHASDGITGIDFPEYMSRRATNGNVLCGGFTDPDGIYEYDELTGAQVQFVDTGALFALGGIRGVHELGNGNILFTNGTGLHSYDPVTGTATTIQSGISCYAINVRDQGAIGTNYCAANLNSTGVAAAISATGSAAVASNDVTLQAASLPANSFGFFLTSTTQGFIANPGGSSGNLCVAGSIGRYVGPGQIKNSGAGGSFELVLDLTQTPQPSGSVAVAVGETWNFQAWYRDVALGSATSNFTDGVSVTFQ